jgi:hypothetical protein
MVPVPKGRVGIVLTGVVGTVHNVVCGQYQQVFGPVPTGRWDLCPLWGRNCEAEPPEWKVDTVPTVGWDLDPPGVVPGPNGVWDLEQQGCCGMDTPGWWDLNPSRGGALKNCG